MGGSAEELFEVLKGLVFTDAVEDLQRSEEWKDRFQRCNSKIADSAFFVLIEAQERTSREAALLYAYR